MRIKKDEEDGGIINESKQRREGCRNYQWEWTKERRTEGLSMRVNKGEKDGGFVNENKERREGRRVYQWE